MPTVALLPPTPERPPELPPLEEPPPPPPDTIVRELQERRTEVSQARDASAPALSGGRRPSVAAEATWRGAIGLVLAKYRRFPAEARAGPAEDRDGARDPRWRRPVAQAGARRKLRKSALDQEAIAMVLRVQPPPKPPAGLPVPIVLTVPVRFSIQ